jgi:hypothetical protein
VLGAFTFEEGGRTYCCAPEQRATMPDGTWWWFTVSNDSQRYAPFEVASSDTQRTVRARIVAWYERRVWVRAQPVAPRERFGRPNKPAAAPVVPPKA